MTTTIDPRLMRLPLKADMSTDKHPEVLREWTDHGYETPKGWYHVAAYTKDGMLLQMLRERLHPTEKEGEAPRTTTLCRGIYWHIDKPYVEEVARQLLHGEREAFAFSVSSSRFVPYSVGYVIITWCDEDGTHHDGEPIMAPESRPVTTEGTP